MQAFEKQVNSRSMTGILALLAMLLSSVVFLQYSYSPEDNDSQKLSMNSKVFLRQRIESRELWARLGFENLSSDLIWLDFIQYFGDTVRGVNKEKDHSFEYLSSITRADPKFIDAYLFSMVALAWKQARPDLAVALLRQGAFEISPSDDIRSYRIWYQIALIEALWNGNSAMAVVAFDRAASAIQEVPNAQRETAGISFTASGLRSLGRRLEAAPNSEQILFDLWLQVFNDASSVEAQALALTRLKDLGGVKYLPDGSYTFVRP